MKLPIGKNKIKTPKDNKMPRRSILSRFDWYNKFRHWWLGKVSVTRSLFRVKAAQQTVLILIIILAVCYIMAAFYTQSGEFVVSIDRDMANDGFLLSETTDFSERLITLHGTAVTAATNINIMDIDRNVMNVDGDHNNMNYLAYTFYLENNTEETRNYVWQLRLKNHTKNAEQAAWIMFFMNGEMTIYAEPNADGGPERQFSTTKFPFMDYASEQELTMMTQLDGTDSGYITREKLSDMGLASADGVYQLLAVPFEADDMVCSGIREDIDPGEYDKFTVVIWIEGEDPECVDDIIGGTIELAMTFTY